MGRLLRDLVKRGLEDSGRGVALEQDHRFRTHRFEESVDEAKKIDEANKIIADLQMVFLGLVRALVDEPEAVTLETSTVGAETVFHLYVAKRDLGKSSADKEELRNLSVFSWLRQA